MVDDASTARISGPIKPAGKTRFGHALLVVIAICSGMIGTVALRKGLKARTAGQLPITVVDLRSTPIVGIVAWRICGPFVVDQRLQSDTRESEKEILATDYLTRDGGEESPLSLPKGITSVPIMFDRDQGDEAKAQRSNGQVLNQNQEFPTPDVSSQELFWGAFHTFKVIYAVTSLYSSVDQDIVMLVPSNSPVKVWLDGYVVVESAEGPDASVHIGARVHLHKGTNTLLVKEMCFPLRNNFHVWLATREGANAFIDEQGGLMIPVTRLLIPRGTALKLTSIVRARYTDNDKSHEASYTIENERDGPVLSGKIPQSSEQGISLEALPDGLYYLRLGGPGSYDRLAFFFGNIQRRVHEYAVSCAAHKLDRLPCDAMPRLLQSLNDPKSDFELAKQNVVIFLLEQFEWSALTDAQSQNYANTTDRVRLMSFRSRIDGSIQYYYMYLPSGEDGGASLPLVVIVPDNSLAAPFFDNNPTLNPFPLQQYARYARKYHLAFIQPFARGARLPSELGEVDILEAIRAALKQDAFDATRIYLAGDCAGGRSALLMAEDYPEMFPVVSTIDAATSHYTQSTGTKRDPGNVLLRLRNLKQTLVGLTQEDPYPHSPASQAFLLTAEAEKVGLKPQLIILPVDKTYTLIYTRQKMFEYLAKHSNYHAQQPKNVDLAIIDFRNHHAYWIIVNRLAAVGKPAYVSAEIRSPGVISITSINIVSLSLDIEKMPDDVRSINAWSINWNGRQLRTTLVADGSHRRLGRSITLEPETALETLAGGR